MRTTDDVRISWAHTDDTRFYCSQEKSSDSSSSNNNCVLRSTNSCFQLLEREHRKFAVPRPGASFLTWPVARACAPSAASILEASEGLIPLNGSSSNNSLATSARIKKRANCNRCHSPSDSPDLHGPGQAVRGGGAREGAKYIECEVLQTCSNEIAYHAIPYHSCR